MHKIKREPGLPSDKSDVGGKCIECDEEFDNREALSHHFKVHMIYTRDCVKVNHVLNDQKLE